jgi:hypothetical protein
MNEWMNEWTISDQVYPSSSRIMQYTLNNKLWISSKYMYTVRAYISLLLNLHLCINIYTKHRDSQFVFSAGHIQSKIMKKNLLDYSMLLKI